MNPTVSIIVPVYKVEPYIRRCIDSILNQTFSDFELILVDDGSPDNCGAICDEYAKKDSRIHVIHQENGGLSAARNAGLDWVFANSDSRWLAFIDSDDWVHGDYLKILLTSALEQDAEISACGMTRTNAYCDDVEIEDPKVTCWSPEQAYCQYYVYCMTVWGVIYRRELYRTVRFPAGKLYEDCFVSQIPLFSSEKVAICEAPLYYYFTNTDSITRKVWSPAALQEIEAHDARLAWLEAHGYQKAVCRELEACVRFCVIRANNLANMCREEETFCPELEALCKKLRFYLQRYNREVKPQMPERFRSSIAELCFRVQRSRLPQKEKKAIERILLRNLRWFIIKYGKQLGMSSETDWQIYVLAFEPLLAIYEKCPILHKPYRFLRRIMIREIKGNVCNESDC